MPALTPSTAAFRRVSISAPRVGDHGRVGVQRVVGRQALHQHSNTPAISRLPAALTASRCVASR